MKTTRTHAVAPHVIAPHAVYYRLDLERLLRVSREVIRSEVRAGRLRVARLAGRYVFLGQWLLDWITACVVSLPASPDPSMED